MQKQTKSFVTLFLLMVFAVCSAQALANGKRLLIKRLHGYGERQQRCDLSRRQADSLYTHLGNRMKDQYRSNLWIVDSDGTRPRELTHGNWRDNSPVWSPDGRRIAFISDRDTTSQLQVLWIDTREVAQLTHLERTPAGLRWSADGKQIAYAYAGQRSDSCGEAA